VTITCQAISWWQAYRHLRFPTHRQHVDDGKFL